MADTILVSLNRWLCLVLLTVGFFRYDAVYAGPLPQPPPPWGTPLSSIVNLGYSKYEGTVLNAGVNQYLGMRYAAPPLGNNRWRAPQDPPRHQSGVHDATQV
jgi:Carboxylesterase family